MGDETLLVEYHGRVLPLMDARWAAFFQELGQEWQHNPEGYFRRAGEPYNPRLEVVHSPLVYLTVQSPDEQGLYRGTRTVVPEMDQPLVFLAIGEPCPYGSSWLDERTGLGVHSLTASGPSWEELYPLYRDKISHALARAQRTRFAPAVGGQQRRRGTVLPQRVEDDQRPE